MKIHLITSCTNLKKSSIKGKISLKDIKCELNPIDTVKSWIESIENPEQQVAVSDLYVGDHWKIANSINYPNLDLWVLSAGYGLVHKSSLVGSYDATFSPDSDNAIKHAGLENHEWWDAIHQYRSKENYSCDDFSSLIELNRSDIFVVAASPSYLKVISSDLKHLISRGILTKDNLVIISSKHNIGKELEDYLLISSADFSSTLKGARVSLNIRLAQYLLDSREGEFKGVQTIMDKYNQLRNNSLKHIAVVRKKLTDDEVINFIRSELKILGIDTGASLLLRNLRSNNLACEQKRFTKLFKQVMAT